MFSHRFNTKSYNDNSVNECLIASVTNIELCLTFNEPSESKQSKIVNSDV